MNERPFSHLDRLAHDGMAFTQAYSGSSICTPTRYGIMTGRYCWRNSVDLASGYTEPYIKPDLPLTPLWPAAPPSAQLARTVATNHKLTC